MTDYQKTKSLFNELGIGFVETTGENGHFYISLLEGKEKVGGYNGFYTLFEFDKEEKIVEVGAYE